MYNIDNLFKEMKKRNINSVKLSKETGISTGNIGDWKSGRSMPSSSKLIILADYFNCSIDYLLGNNEFEISDDEKYILNNYRALDDLGKKNLTNSLKKETKRIENIENIINPKKFITTEPSYIESIKTYELSTSAGTGTFITDDVPFHFEQVNLRTTPQARRANFAVYVRGDSMEPNYFDGDMVFVKEQPAINNGEIGIFIYNDESYIKKYEVRKDGAYLVSLNKEYPPIKIKQSYNFKCCGLVL